MADFVRCAKSGSHWSTNDLLAYNITVSRLPPDQFFRSCPELSLDHLDPALLTAPPGADDPSLSGVVSRYLFRLGLATKTTKTTQEVDFAVETLRLLGFDDCNTVVCRRIIIPLTICGDSHRVVKMDVCLLNCANVILLVLFKSKILLNKTDAESRVVVGAIAAFQFNNKNREAKGLPCLDAMTIPCVAMSGTRPTFYLVPVTEELSTAVITGQYPSTETQVLKCVTQCTNDSEEMDNVEYRKLAFKHFITFKTLAISHWDKILPGF